MIYCDRKLREKSLHFSTVIFWRQIKMDDPLLTWNWVWIFARELDECLSILKELQCRLRCFPSRNPQGKEYTQNGTCKRTRSKQFCRPVFFREFSGFWNAFFAGVFCLKAFLKFSWKSEGFQIKTTQICKRVCSGARLIRTRFFQRTPLDQAFFVCIEGIN